jgi:HK97 family phage prohead protease
MENRKATRVFEIRASQGEEFVLAGRALSYNEISSNELVQGVREKIMPGCFRASLASGKPVFALLNHDMKALPLGRTDNGTLQISDGDQALNFRVQLDRNNSQHRDVYAAVQRKDVSECSFQFICLDEDFQSGSYQGESCQVRCVRQAELIDVSVVTQPFYGDGATAVSARAAAATGTAKLTDDERRVRVATIGRLVDADRRAMQEAEVSDMSDWASMRLKNCLAAMPVPHRYVAHSVKHSAVFAIPENVFDGDTDMSDEDALRSGHWYQYGVDAGGNVTVRYDAEQLPEGPDNPVDRTNTTSLLAELRDRAVWKRRMRVTAGIFTR